MKKTVLAIMMTIIIILFTGCVRKYPQGAWQLVRSERVENGKSIIMFPGQLVGSEFKIWSDRNFMFVGRWKVDTVITDNYGFGVYSLEGKQYEETVLYHFDRSYQGQKIKMTLELKGDTMIQIYHPRDTQGNSIDNISSVEKYVRTK